MVPETQSLPADAAVLEEETLSISNTTAVPLTPVKASPEDFGYVTVKTNVSGTCE